MTGKDWNIPWLASFWIGSGNSVSTSDHADLVSFMSGVIRLGALLWDSLETSVGFNVKCGNRLVSILDQEEVYYTHQDTEKL